MWRPKSVYVNSSHWPCPSEHQADHCDIDHAFAAIDQLLVILAVAATPADPREGPFHDPSFGKQYRTVRSRPRARANVLLSRSGRRFSNAPRSLIWVATPLLGSGSKAVMKCCLHHIGRDAPDFNRFAALVAAYPDRRRRRRSSDIKLRCRYD